MMELGQFGRGTEMYRAPKNKSASKNTVAVHRILARFENLALCHKRGKAVNPVVNRIKIIYFLEFNSGLAWPVFAIR